MHPSRFSRRCAVLFLAFACAGPAFAKRPTPTPNPDTKAHGDLSEGLGVAPGAAPLPEVVATVNGESIHRADLERVFATLLSANGRTPAELSDAERNKGYHSVLEEMIADRLLAKEAGDEKVDELEVEKRLDAVKAGLNPPDTIESVLKKSGQTMDQVRGNIRAQIRQQQWLEAHIADRIKVTPEEVDKFYKDNPDRFQLPEMVRASHILLAVRRDAAPETVLEKETTANEIEARLKKGEKFEDLAKQFSDDPNAKQTGGDLDFFGRDRIMPEFAEAAFKMKIGDVSAPVRTNLGFHVIKLTDHRDPRLATLDESRAQILAYLQDAKRRQAVTDLLTTLRSNAKVDIRIP